ncbi:MAG: SH3 domain-containing protein [Chloroflexi bacterium]|nr:SH3 domain-containing protein [Chloroflexota bacterium]
MGPRISRSRLLPVVALSVATMLVAACGKSSAVTPGATPTINIVISGIATPGATTTSSSQAAGQASSTTAQTLTISTTTSSAAATTSINVTDAASGQSLVVAGTGGANLRIRATPNGKEIAAVPQGTKLIALGTPPQQAGNYTWIQIRTLTGMTGWVASQYVTAGS